MKKVKEPLKISKEVGIDAYEELRRSGQESNRAWRKGMEKGLELKLPIFIKKNLEEFHTQ